MRYRRRCGSARATADEGQDKAGAARDLLDAGKRLQGKDEAPEKGYKDEDSRQLERIIENANEDR